MSDICRNAGGILFQKDGTAMAVEQLANFSDEVTEGRNNDSIEEERV